MKKNLVLTGMMGVGKSTIGESLARKLKMKFADIDKVIENKEGKSIKTIFKTSGENYFREIEKKTTLKFLEKNNYIISLGGGAFIDDDIRETVIKKCVSFWLDVNIDLLVKRVSNVNKRPLLNIADLKDTMNKIYKERKNIYELADFKITCDKINKSLIIEKILKKYEDN